MEDFLGLGTADTALGEVGGVWSDAQPGIPVLGWGFWLLVGVW